MIPEVPLPGEIRRMEHLNNTSRVFKFYHVVIK
jgi:hypothetical protein